MESKHSPETHESKFLDVVAVVIESRNYSKQQREQDRLCNME
jgi:hypothetical protein